MKKKIRLNNNIIGKGKTIESKILKSILLFVSYCIPLLIINVLLTIIDRYGIF